MDSEGSEPSTIMSEMFMVELSENTPEIHLKTKRGFSEPKLVYAGE